MSNSLAEKLPHLLDEWHPTKNIGLNPYKVSIGSSKKVWWICSKEHEWQGFVYNRSKGNGCPYCKNKKVCLDNCLETINPELSKEWHPILNENLSPKDIVAGSCKKIWWICSNGHEWKTRVVDRTSQNKGCPYCTSRFVSYENCLENIDPELSKEWHPTKNGKLTPKNFTYGSSKKVWWVCNKGHEWCSVLKSRTDNIIVRGCPYCSNRKVCIDNCLENIDPELSKEWHPTKNGKLTPKNFTYGSSKKVWWVCNKGHEWSDFIGQRSNGRKCPYCSGKRVCIDNCLETINPELAKEWHPTKNDKLTPKDFTYGSNKKVWWICSYNSEHEWSASIKNRDKGNGCPYCKNKTEEKCRKIFEEIFKVEFYKIRPKWLVNPKTNNLLELDGYNERLSLAFEYDGKFHYERHPKGDEKSFEDQRDRDLVKNSLCKQNGVTLIRIPYTENNNLDNFIKENNKIKDFLKKISESINH